MRRLLTLGACLLTAAQLLPAQTSGRHPPGDAATPHGIVGNVHFVGTTELGIFLITTRDGHILIDAGADETVPLVRAAVERLGFRYEDIRVLLSSHAHAEHAGGLARIRRETGARLMAMADDAGFLERGRDGIPLVEAGATYPRAPVDRRLRDGDVVTHGGQRVLVRHTPGHTKGSATFVTTVQERGRAMQVVFATDTSLAPGRLSDDSRYPEAVADWQRTFAVLETLVADVWVTGHTGVFDMHGKLERSRSGASNPYIDPQGFRRHLAESRAALGARLASELAR